GHVEVFQMASVRTSIIGRPRRLSRHRRAHPVTRTYTLRCEEPLKWNDVEAARKAASQISDPPHRSRCTSEGNSP
ncbi:hypothetical protein DS079_15220, partial [Brachybacterium paraconglomeratum]